MNYDYKVYTDGGCNAPGKEGGYGVVIIEGNHQPYTLKGGYLHTTNNRMELMGAIKALEHIRNIAGNMCVKIYSDSQYLVKTMTENWKKAKNNDLWDIIDDLLVDFKRVDFEWVKGHAGNPFNERCDELATEGLMGIGVQLQIDEGYEAAQAIYKKEAKSREKHRVIQEMRESVPNYAENITKSPDVMKTPTQVLLERQIDTDLSLPTDAYTMYNIKVGSHLIGTDTNDLYVIANIEMPVFKDNLSLCDVLVVLSRYGGDYISSATLYTMKELYTYIYEGKLTLVDDEN